MFNIITRRAFIVALIFISALQITTSCRIPTPCGDCNQAKEPWKALASLSVDQKLLGKSFQAATSKVYNLVNEISAKPKGKDADARAKTIADVKESIEIYKDVLEQTNADVDQLEIRLKHIDSDADATMQEAEEVTDSIPNELEQQKEDAKNWKLAKKWNKAVAEVQANMKRIDELIKQGEIVKKKLELIAIRDRMDVIIKDAEGTSTEANKVIEDLEKLLNRIDKFIESHSNY